MCLYVTNFFNVLIFKKINLRVVYILIFINLFIQMGSEKIFRTVK